MVAGGDGARRDGPGQRRGPVPQEPDHQRGEDDGSRGADRLPAHRPEQGDTIELSTKLRKISQYLELLDLQTKVIRRYA